MLRIYDRPDYDSITGDDPIQGPRRQSIAMLLLPVTTSLFKYQPDPDARPSPPGASTRS